MNFNDQLKRTTSILGLCVVVDDINCGDTVEILIDNETGKLIIRAVLNKEEDI